MFREGIGSHVLEIATHEDAIGRTTVLVRSGEEVIGSLALSSPRPWQENARMVIMVEVHPDYRRQGIATGMWRYAKAQGLNPTHELIKTEDGDAWSKAVGD